ncbi:MAG: DUF615 domain-containing protein [Burkholderiaceae bacterium]|jgi:ribosome-associated protein|nr:DUF615 domain-containing protein [Burkholderiaceae bacterium]
MRKHRHLPPPSQADSAPEDARPSKSQRKRDMTALQQYGEELVNLPPERFKSITLPEPLQDAVLTCRRITHHEGRRRQLQFIGKLMRKLDPAVIRDIAEKTEGWRNQSRTEKASLHRIEAQRDKLLKQDAALTDLLAQYPDMDVPHLRNLIRNARKEQLTGAPPRAYREIFQVLKQTLIPPPRRHTEEGENA